MDWQSFRESCPAIGEIAEERFRKDQIVLLGTIRKDGSARISPCEVDFAKGQLLLGMMLRSPKALDLLRDPHIVVHSGRRDRTETDGDVKIYGRAVDVQDPEMRRVYRETIQARIGWAPEEPAYHLFRLDVTSAAYVIFGQGETGDQEDVMAWDAARGLRTWRKAGS